MRIPAPFPSLTLYLTHLRYAIELGSAVVFLKSVDDALLLFEPATRHGKRACYAPVIPVLWDLSTLASHSNCTTNRLKDELLDSYN